MDWTVYWFMFPACVVIASVAMFSGISGAAMLTPLFLIGFPLLGVPRLSTVAAIGTSLFLETAGFGVGVGRYLAMRLADLRTALSVVAVTLPLGALGAVAARQVPAQALRIGYGVAMIGLAWVLARKEESPATPGGAPASGSGLVAGPALVAGSRASHLSCGKGQERRIVAVSGQVYEYCAHGLGLQRLLSGLGGFVAGLISTGVGEATLPGLVRRSRFPVAVAAATSTVIVGGTVAGAAATHLVQLLQEGGMAAVPWNLVVWAVPGAVIGASVGTRMQGRVSEAAARRFFSALFGLIGVTFLMAFTLFAPRFA